jgi:hypothetical protein
MGRGTTKRAVKAAAKTSLHLRLDFGDERSIGPGKIRLLELINETGSISAAGRALAMSYRQAWLLVDELNRMFREPVVTAQTGGGGGGRRRGHRDRQRHRAALPRDGAARLRRLDARDPLPRPPADATRHVENPLIRRHDRGATT